MESNIDRGFLLLFASIIMGLFTLIKCIFYGALRNSCHYRHEKHSFLKQKYRGKKMDIGLSAIVHEICGRESIDADLMCAIISIESNWNPLSVRFEEKFENLEFPEQYAHQEGITVETEIILQKMSFGLCQIMGGTARSIGFSEPLMRLLDARENIEMGVKFFKIRCKHYPVLDDQIAAYNAGKPYVKDGKYVNQVYVDKVLECYYDLIKLKT